MPVTFDEVLETRSNLTKTQIQTILLQKMVRDGELSLKGALAKRGSNGVTAGAYYRVLAQTRSSVEESLYTLLLCARIRVLKADDLQRLLDTVAKIPSELDQETSEQVISLVDALAKRIVML